MTLTMSFILGSGFVIASQTALAVQFSYPYSSSSYNKPYNPHNNNNNNNISSSSSYDNASYNKPDSIYNNDKIDKYSDSYSISAEYSKYPTIDKIYECQTGPLEGFFTSSVEFCIAANEKDRQ